MSKPAAHTPGPWTATSAGMEQPGIYVVYPIARTAIEDAANARLIAAAPELYAAMSWLGSLMLDVSDGGQAWCAIRERPGAKAFFANMKSGLAKAVQS